MKPEKRAIQLSRQEVTYLRDAKFLPATLARIIDNVSFTSNERGVVEVTDEIAEQFRATFTERLAKAGFDADYEPTYEGKLLEGLIDRFYVA